jgi:ribosomal protein S18 acetylase RimI-like enzyme
MKITFTPVSDETLAIALAAYASTRELDLSVVPWTDEQKMAFIKMQFTAQQSDYQRRFPDAEHLIIEVDKQPAGRLYLTRLEDSIRILDITILPAQRNQGLGTQILKDLMTEAQRTGRAVRIYVESFNPALCLFERLGFSNVEELGAHYLMERRSEGGRGVGKGGGGEEGGWEGGRRGGGEEGRRGG